MKQQLHLRLAPERSGWEQEPKKMRRRGPVGGGDGGVRVRRGGEGRGGVKGVSVRWRTLRGSVKDGGRHGGRDQ